MKNIIVFGGAGFIGTNLAIALSNSGKYNITLVDKSLKFFSHIEEMKLDNISFVEEEFNLETDFDELLKNKDIVYHLVSSTVPTTSNKAVSGEITNNVVVTSNLLEACVKHNIKQVLFISSGGTIYGKEGHCPLREETPTYPITSYGLQKITIEKLLYLYNYMHNLDYRVIRLANPYGPYQRPNGILGAVTTFTYKAVNDETITVYGAGEIVRDYIYIDDAIKAIINISENNGKHKVYNVGSGIGTSINKLLKVIKEALEKELSIEYKEKRKVDVPENYLDVSRYENEYGKLANTSLKEGILKTAEFLKKVN